MDAREGGIYDEGTCGLAAHVDAVTRNELQVKQLVGRRGRWVKLFCRVIIRIAGDKDEFSKGGR